MAGAQQDDPGHEGQQTTSFVNAFNEFSSRSSARPPMDGVGEIQRGRFHCIMVTGFTLPLINEMDKQARESAKLMAKKNGVRILIDVWPFLPTIFDKATEAAWPHKNVKKAFSPLLAWYTWTDQKNDDFWIDNMKTALGKIRCVAEDEGCFADGAPIYLNTTLGDTSVLDIYRGNYLMLSHTRAKYDPQNVMGKARGFTIPLS